MQYDAIIIGGSFAGLSAALYLGRARRTVCVIDTARPRNRFAEASHGQFGYDGGNPLTMLATMRKQVAAYPTVEFIDQAAVNMDREGDRFTIRLEDGNQVRGARLLLAFGIVDQLPDIPGLAERWGHSVIHCPYCHGYEFSDRRLGVLSMSPASAHQASLIPEWGPTTFFLNGGTIDLEVEEDLARRGVVVEPGRIAGLQGRDKDLSAIKLDDGREVPLDALYIGPFYRFSSDLADQLGCAIEPGLLGPIVTVDEMKATSVADVFAAGDITRMGHSVTFACADGVMAAIAIHRSFLFGGAA